MKILIVLTYYRPHTSGLTIYAERLAQAFAERGHEVTVLTSQYDPSLPRDEVQEGVHIVRVPVLFRLSKGVIMPGFGMAANRWVHWADVIQLHLPQFDAAGIALRGRLAHKPTVITYHCDVSLPPSLVGMGANVGIRVMNNLAALFTHKIVTYTRDYAENSDYLTRYMHKLQVIPPPVTLPAASREVIHAFAEQNELQAHRPVIGMAVRFATEKGVEVMLEALPEILKVYPKAQVLFAGPYQNIVGEEAYFRRLIPEIRKYEATGNWRFLGTLNPAQMAVYYPNLDVLVLPSLNSTEAFGLVQIEAMMNGVPCVASDLPGVRQPVKIHQMGKIIGIHDSKGLAASVLAILAAPDAFKSDPQAIKTRYMPATIAGEYEMLFAELTAQVKHGTKK